MATTTNYGFTLHEATDKPGAAFRQDNANMADIDTALHTLANQVSAAGMPVGSVLWMTSDVNPSTVGAPGTWTRLFSANIPLTTSKVFYLYERTA